MGTDKKRKRSTRASRGRTQPDRHENDPSSKERDQSNRRWRARRLLAPIGLLLTGATVYGLFLQVCAARQESRALLMPFVACIPDFSQSPVRIVIGVENSGKLIATNIESHVFMSVRDLPVEPDLDLAKRERADADRNFIAAGERMGVRSFVPLKDWELEGIRSGEALFYVILRLRYNDGFRDGRETQRCWYWSRQDDDWAQCPGHQRVK